MNCPSCSAPVPARGVECSYCGSRLDLDLKGWSHLHPIGLNDQLQCPDGHGHLESLQLSGPEPIQVERCRVCLGLFLPLGNLERLLDQAIGQVWTVDRALLNALVETPRYVPEPMRYRPCPSCGELMNRRLHGRRSGVVVDHCRDHGLWLDAGELRQLLEWARAGGARLEHQRRELEQHRDNRRLAMDLAEVDCQDWGPDEQRRDGDLLSALVRLARQLL